MTALEKLQLHSRQKQAAIKARDEEDKYVKKLAANRKRSRENWKKKKQQSKVVQMKATRGIDFSKLKEFISKKQ